jgi:hypothetical protein
LRGRAAEAQRSASPFIVSKMSNQTNDLYLKWSKWIDVLDTEILNLHTQRHIFQEVQNILRANPKMQSPDDFNFWLAVWYASAMSVAVRKQADNDKDSISYQRLLEGIKANPTVISRERFKKNFVNGWNYSEADANEGFDQLIGSGRQYIDPTIVDREINELGTKTDKLSHYVNKRIAHHDKKDFTAIPRFSDLHEAIDYLGTLHKKYYMVFRCFSTDLLTVWQYDWKSVFLYPWIDLSSGDCPPE